MSTTVTKTVIQRYTRKDGTIGESPYTYQYEPKRKQRSEEEIREIVDKRKAGATVDSLCKEYKMSCHTFYKYMSKIT
jgi:DNA invertase Pin-like site-specific DNA recombinase